MARITRDSQRLKGSIELVDEHGTELGLREFSADAGKSRLCSSLQVCACNATGCGASTDAGIDFDLLFSGDTAEGSTTVSPGIRTDFTRVAN